MNVLKPLSKGALVHYMEHHHEILLETYEGLIASQEPLVQEELACLKKEELYTHLEFHQKLMLTIFHFPNNGVLFDNLAWIYRRLKHYGVDERFLRVELRAWRAACAHYLPANFVQEIDELYGYIEEKLEYIILTHTKMKRIRHEQYDEVASQAIEMVYGQLFRGETAAFKHYAFERCNSLASFLDFFNKVISPVMVRVGFEWEEGVIGVAKEHMISAQVNDVVVEAFSRFKGAKETPPEGVTVLVATAPKELHAIGAKTVAKMLDFEGFRTFYLGSDLEKREILNATQEIRPDVLVLSVTLEVHLAQTRELVRSLRHPPASFRGKIVLGGGGLRNLPDAKAQLDVDCVCETMDGLLEYLKITYPAREAKEEL